MKPGFDADQLPVLGAGLGFREPWRDALLSNPVLVGFLEITLDHYLQAPPWKMRELERLSEKFVLIPHGLHLSVGSADGVDLEYLEQVAKLVERLQPPWWSEHVAWTRAAGVDLGHLAPVPFSEEALDVIARNLAVVREHIPTPLILENITYHLHAPGSQMEEAQFLTELTRRTGCGLLLDVTNLYVNSVNHHYNALAFLEALPKERVVQLHFAGGTESVPHSHGLLTDTHSAPVSAPVWDLLEQVLSCFPVHGVILERDEQIPALHEVMPEVDRANELGVRLGRWTARNR